MHGVGGHDQRQGGGGWSSAKGGELGIDAPGQHVLMRTSCVVNGSGDIEGRFTVALPAAGRTIKGQWAATVLVQQLPSLVQASLTFPPQSSQAIKTHIESVEDQQSLRQQVGAAGLVAFGASTSAFATLCLFPAIGGVLLGSTSSTA